MTVYRRWPDMAALTSDVLAREFPLAGLAALCTNGNASATSIAGAVVALVAEIENNPLFVKMIDVDPELLLPYLLHHPGTSQDSVLAALTSAIRYAQRHADVRRARPDVLARTVVLMGQGFALSGRTMREDRYSERIARREQQRAVASYLT